MRWLTLLFYLGLGVPAATPVLAQIAGFESRPPTEFAAAKAPVLDTVQFSGLRHISPAAVAAQLSLREGEEFDSAKLRHDIHTLGRLGWFESIRVEQIEPPSTDSATSESPKRMALLFDFEEQPFLSSVVYSGSRLLSSNQIEKLLEEKKLAPGLGKPANPAVLQQIAVAIRYALNELAHPEASVQVHRQLQENATLGIRFQITDGPHLPVRWVRFDGDPGLTEKQLRAQMQSIAPWKPFASLRSKDAFTRAAFEEDRHRMLTYYVDHGYPEAHVANAQISKFIDESWNLFPFPHRALHSGLLLSIPVQAGSFYRLESIEPSESLQRAAELHSGKPLPLLISGERSAFSQQEVDKLRRFYSYRLQSHDQKSNAPWQSVEANPIFDSETHTVRLKLNLNDSPPYLVHRLEFQGLHKFSDRYVRRRIPLREGHPLDEHALEVGLAKLARTGYFKPIRRENIRIQLDDARRTADISIHLEEIGQQRASLVGGRGQFGSTLGLAYTVFDLLNCEELLSAKLEGGPESLDLVLGIAKEGIFGTRGSLAFSIFDNVIRPRFAHGVQGPFVTSHSEGVSIPWTYALTNTDSLGVSYTLSKTTTDEPLGSVPGLTGLAPLDLRTRTSSRALGTAWVHDTGNERLRFSDSASGGFLGGDENMVHASGEAARIFRDPFFSSANAWAFRTTFSAAGSYRGQAPYYSRFFSGDEFVRGLQTGELGPLALTEKTAASSATTFAPSYAGANLTTAANAEYRIPLHNGIETAAFFDLGSGRLLPNWLGPSRPMLLSVTNSVLHGSTGVELRWTVPGVQVPLRTYYAINVLRLDRVIPLSDKSLLHAHNRFAVFGWGLGSLF